MHADELVLLWSRYATLTAVHLDIKYYAAANVADCWVLAAIAILIHFCY